MDRERQERRIQTACLLAVAAVALGGALYWLRPVMIPFVLAVFLALAAAPVVDLQVRRLRFPRLLAVLSTLVLAGLAMAVVGLLVSASLNELRANAGAYQANVSVLIARTAEALPLEAFGVGADKVLASLREIPVSAAGNLLLSTTNAIVELLSQSLLVGIFVVYLLIGGSSGRVAGVRGEIERRIERYLATKAVLSAATGLLVGGVLTLLDIDLAMVFGLFAFLLNFIPSIGSLIATLLPLPVVIASPDVSVTIAVLAIALPGGIQFAIGNIIEPKVMGDALDLHPIAILMALILWGMLWGVVGMLLATPITAMMKILFEQLEQTRPIADLLAGRVGR